MEEEWEMPALRWLLVIRPDVASRVDKVIFNVVDLKTPHSCLLLYRDWLIDYSLCSISSKFERLAGNTVHSSNMYEVRSSEI